MFFGVKTVIKLNLIIPSTSSRGLFENIHHRRIIVNYFGHLQNNFKFLWERKISLEGK